MKLRFSSILLYLFSSLWLVFAIFWFFRDSDYRYFYSLGGIAYALALSISAYFLNKKRKWAWWLAIFMVGGSIIIAFCDQLGWLDFAFILGEIFLFIILLKDRPLS